MKNPLLDPPAISAPQFNTLAQSIATLFGTRHDVLLPQGEAVLPLEAAARGVAHPGSTALNVITSPYGRAFGRWLREGGTEVVEVEAPKGQPIDPGVVLRALEQHPEISVVSFVHVEAISGVRNDAALISQMAHDHGAIVVLDAVASIGAHDVAIDEWGLDITVLAPQKALAGPAGISIAVINDRAWKVLSDNPRAPRGSILSLLDWKEQWLDTDRSVVPIILAPLEVLALEAAVERLQREGLTSVTRRHRAAAAASRAGARALGLTPFVEDDDAAVVVTTLRAPDGSDARSLVRAASAHGAPALSPGFGELSTDVIRIDHTGERARLDVVLASLNALGSALGEETPDQVAIDAALATASQAWTDELDAN